MGKRSIITEEEIVELITIFHELATKYGLDNITVTREEAVDIISKNRVANLQGRRYARRLGYAITEYCDNQLKEIINAV